MFRCILAFGLFSLAGILSAAPVPKALKKNKTPDLVGTTWVGQEDGFGAVTYTFLADGRFEYRHGTSEPFCNGTWNQTGDDVYWEHNKRYAECRAKIEDGTLKGVKTNINQETWTITISLRNE